MLASGMVATVYPAKPVRTKDGRDTSTTTIQLLDETAGVLYLKLWGETLPDGRLIAEVKQGESLQVKVRRNDWTDKNGKVHDEWIAITPRDS